MKKLALLVLGLLFIGVVLGGAYIALAPDLPSDVDDIIERAQAMELPEYYHGQEKIASNGDIDIWYEVNSANAEKKGTVLLIMGYGSTSLQWPPYLFEQFQEAGYDVIRFDHRDIGKSTWLTDWDESNPYDLSDLAADAKSILDNENINKAHIVGMSMGGMVAQTFAIEYPESTLSLTSMSSSAYFDDEDLPGIWPETVTAIGRYTLKYSLDDSQETQYKFNLTASNLFKGKYELDNTNTVLKARYEMEKRNGVNPDAGTHHEAAITASGSRYDRLADIKIPTLVIHGKSDPLVNFAHGQKTAELIPHAKTLFFDDLGHDIPKHFAGQMSTAMINQFDNVVGEAVGTELAMKEN